MSWTNIVKDPLAPDDMLSRGGWGWGRGGGGGGGG